LDLRSQGFTQKEIASTLGCGERSVRRWLSDTSFTPTYFTGDIDEELNIDTLKNIFSSELIPQIMFYISLGYKNNLKMSISFLNDMDSNLNSISNISEPWLAAISGFDYLTKITGVSKFEDINNIIRNEKPYDLSKNRKKFRRRINSIVPDLRYELIALFDISNISKNDFEIKGDDNKNNISDQLSDHIYVSNLKIAGTNEDINKFINSKYGLLLEIESRLPDLDRSSTKISVNKQKQIPLTLILLKLFLIP
jgi:transcriptional regulator with XRE-family HTH domain